MAEGPPVNGGSPASCGKEHSRRRVSESDVQVMGVARSSPPLSVTPEPRLSVDLSSSGGIQVPRKAPSVKKTLETLALDLVKKRRHTATSIRNVLSKRSTSSCPPGQPSGLRIYTAAAGINETGTAGGGESSNSVPSSPTKAEVKLRAASEASGSIKNITIFKRTSLTSMSSNPLGCRADTCSTAASVSTNESRVNSTALSQSELYKVRVTQLKQRLAVLRSVLDERQVAHSNMERMLESFGHGADIEEEDQVKSRFTADRFDATVSRNYTLVPGDEETQLAKGSHVSVSGYLAASQRWRFTSKQKVSVTMHAIPSASDFSIMEAEPPTGYRSSCEDMNSTERSPSVQAQSFSDIPDSILEVGSSKSLTQTRSGGYGPPLSSTSLPREPSMFSLPGTSSVCRASAGGGSPSSNRIANGSLPHELSLDQLHRLENGFGQLGADSIAGTTNSLALSCSMMTLPGMALSLLPRLQYEYPLLGSLPKSILDRVDPDTGTFEAQVDEEDNSDGADTLSRGTSAA